MVGQKTIFWLIADDCFISFLQLPIQKRQKKYFYSCLLLESVACRKSKGRPFFRLGYVLWRKNNSKTVTLEWFYREMRQLPFYRIWMSDRRFWPSLSKMAASNVLIRFRILLPILGVTQFFLLWSWPSDAAPWAII